MLMLAAGDEDGLTSTGARVERVSDRVPVALVTIA